MKRNNFRLSAALLLFLSAAVYSQSNESAVKLPGAQTAPPAADKAATPAPSSPEDPGSLLGLLPADVIDRIGSPEAVYPLRGESHWQDDVVFYYTANLYLFFYNNQVWQIRADYRFKGDILGITPAMSREDIYKILGKPYHTEESEDLYLNPAGITRLAKGFPLRMRLVYDGSSKLYDIYLYRGDF